jgi:hypothetical protein
MLASTSCYGLASTLSEEAAAGGGLFAAAPALPITTPRLTRRQLWMLACLGLARSAVIVKRRGGGGGGTIMRRSRSHSKKSQDWVLPSK